MIYLLGSPGELGNSIYAESEEVYQNASHAVACYGVVKKPSDILKAFMGKEVAFSPYEGEIEFEESVESEIKPIIFRMLGLNIPAQQGDDWTAIGANPAPKTSEYTKDGRFYQDHVFTQPETSQKVNWGISTSQPNDEINKED